jgi:hypothetical protein
MTIARTAFAVFRRKIEAIVPTIGTTKQYTKTKQLSPSDSGWDPLAGSSFMGYGSLTNQWRGFLKSIRAVEKIEHDVHCEIFTPDQEIGAQWWRNLARRCSAFRRCSELKSNPLFA